MKPNTATDKLCPALAPEILPHSCLKNLMLLISHCNCRAGQVPYCGPPSRHFTLWPFAEKVHRPLALYRVVLVQFVPMSERLRLLEKSLQVQEQNHCGPFRSEGRTGSDSEVLF